MKKKRITIAKVIGLLGAIIPFIMAIIKEALSSKSQLFTTFFWVVIGISCGVLIACGIFLIILSIQESKNAKNLADTSSILRRSRKIANDLKKVVKKIDKVIAKRVRHNEFASNLDESNLEEAKQNIKLIAGIKDKKTKKVLQNLFYLEEISGKAVVKELNESELTDSKIAELNQEVLRAIKEMNRALLVLEQYDTRILLGDYVLEHSSDVFECADALIDYKGWTYSLLGHTDKFKESIEKGIKLLEDFAKNEAKNSKEYIEAQFKLARAKRHLGSDIISTKKDPKQAVKYNEEALKILENTYKNGEIRKNEAEYLESLKSKDLSPKALSEIKKVNEMYVGIVYGKLNAGYYILKNNQLKEPVESLTKDACKLIEEIREIKGIAKHFDNQHRYVKIVLLENELIRLIEKQHDAEANKAELTKLFTKEKDVSKALLKEFSDNTDIVDEIFSKAIYADEVMEIYIRQEVDELYKNIKEIVK